MSRLVPQTSTLATEPEAFRAFAESVTHRIRTPLTALMTHAHLIEATARRIPHNDEYAPVLARILESAAAIQESADRLARDVDEVTDQAMR